MQKNDHSEIRIAINDESQGSIAKNFRCDELLYYTFITHSAGERIFKIGEHLAKLRAKSLTVSYTPFALHFTIRYDTIRYFNVRSKADISQLNLPHGTDN